jgi:hypothetical protein
MHTVNAWKRLKTAGGSWRQLVAGGAWRRLEAAGGGWWRLVAAGGGWWRLVAGGWWRGWKSAEIADIMSLCLTDTINDKDKDKDKERMKMKKINLFIDNQSNLRFTGTLINSVDSKDDTKHSGRWTELDLYKTKSGKYVCHQIGKTIWEGEHDRYEGKVCENEKEIIDFFGQGWLAKELYEVAGIDNSIEID